LRHAIVPMVRRKRAKEGTNIAVLMTASGGYDSNAVRTLVVKRAIEPSIPRRKNNRGVPPQDGRTLRRYRHRWIIERTNSWSQNFRRLVVRYEHSVKTFEALVHMACALITLKKV
jgi:transposase